MQTKRTLPRIFAFVLITSIVFVVPDSFSDKTKNSLPVSTANSTNFLPAGFLFADFQNGSEWNKDKFPTNRFFDLIWWTYASTLCVLVMARFIGFLQIFDKKRISMLAIPFGGNSPPLLLVCL